MLRVCFTIEYDQESSLACEVEIAVSGPRGQDLELEVYKNEQVGLRHRPVSFPVWDTTFRDL